jgi:Mrp family chromosome partitioning ATPase/uncharacterized protein involved in exopolysaccharide biosynthesis
MTTESDFQSLEPDLFTVIRDRWVLIVGLAAIFGLVGLLVGGTRQAKYSSTASVVVEDPQTSSIFESSSGSKPERYLETQIGIIGSPAVAERASELLAEGSPEIDVAPEVIVEELTVISREASDLVSVTFSATEPEVAERTADAIVTAYLELRQSEAVAGFTSALEQLDRSIAEAERNLEELGARIEGIRGVDVSEIETEAEQALARLLELQQADQIDADAIAAVTEQLRAFETLYNLESLRPELTALLEEQRLAQSRLSDLLARRNAVSVDAELAGGEFIFVTAATPAERSSGGARVFTAVGVMIGLMVGMALAYSLANWRRRVSSPLQLEAILQTPALGTIPDFDVIAATPLPVANAPRSRAAEAYRFVMAAVESQLFGSAGSSSGVRQRMVLVTSAAAHDGRSTFVANVAIAAARSGRKVLVVDADFETQDVSRILMSGSEPTVGITEIVIGALASESAIKPTPIIPGITLHLLSQGSDLMGAQDIFGSSEAADLFDSLREEYDLILVDSPPLPTVGYATTLARLADRVLIVVRHRTMVAQLEELRQRLTLLQSRKIGYVYNRAPSGSDIRRPVRSTTTQAEPQSSESESEVASSAQ